MVVMSAKKMRKKGKTAPATSAEIAPMMSLTLSGGVVK
jgi:hypothetical protein